MNDTMGQCILKYFLNTVEDAEIHPILEYAYAYALGTGGVTSYGIAQTSSARSDVRDHFKECLSSSSELLNRAIKVLLSKGIYVRAPYISSPESPEFVKKEGFLKGYFGDRRPLNSLEINHLYLNIVTNAIGAAMTLGFCQVAKSQEVVNYLVRGKEIAKKHVEVFSNLLKDDDLPAPMTWETDITGSRWGQAQEGI